LKTNILLTSAGGLTGVYLAKHLSQFSDLNIIAIDMNENTPLNKWTDKFYVVPSLSSNLYLAAIDEIIKTNCIDIIIPVTSYDVAFYSLYKDQALFNKLKILTVNFEDNEILSNKEKLYSYLSSLKIQTPLIYHEDNLIYPCFMKPKIGSGSKNTQILFDYEELEYWSKKFREFIVMEYLEGSEYTVDCLFDWESNCLGYNVRERIKVSNGGATITQNNTTIDICEIIEKLEKTKKIIGPINFQFKLKNNGDIVIFDFNTRFASGGLPLTIHSGFDIPRNLIDLLQGKTINKFVMDGKYNSSKMIRFYDEYFVD
jgi:carbamoyl-phosphate synthase large subunit